MNSCEALSALDELRTWLVDNQRTLDNAEIPLDIHVRPAVSLDKDQLKILARTHGTWMKQYPGEWFTLTRGFGRGRKKAYFSSWTERAEVCKAVLTGRRVTVSQAKTVEYEDVEVDEVAWECDPILRGTSE